MEIHEAQLHGICEALRELAHDFRRLVKFLTSPRSAKLRIEGEMDLTALLTDAPGKAVFSELDASGNPVAPVGVVSYSSSNPGVAQIDSSGQLTYIGAGATIISAVDAGDNLQASATLTLTTPQPPPPVAVSAKLDLVAGSTPVAAATKPLPTL